MATLRTRVTFALGVATTITAGIAACGGKGTDAEEAPPTTGSGGVAGSGGIGGAGGTGGVVASGGTGGTPALDAASDRPTLTCNEATDAFKSAIAAARACDPAKPGQCAMPVDLASGCLSCPGRTFVEASNTAAVQAIGDTIAEGAELRCGNCGGCAGGLPPATRASCVVQPGAGGASCVDSYGTGGGVADAGSAAAFR